MRTREQSATVASSDRTAVDLVNHTSSTITGANTGYVSSQSSITDDPTGNRKKNKSCVHLSYYIGLLNCPYSVYDSSDLSNAPNPRTRYDGYMPSTSDQFYSGLQQNILNPGAYIPVTGRSTDDLSGCVFNAYNQFTNEYRGMDGSQSVCEAGETPQLFRLWSRRKGLASNIVSGFLNYSFGWKPLLSDLISVSRELRRLPSLVRQRLSNQTRQLVRHYKFDLSDTVNDYSYLFDGRIAPPNDWKGYYYEAKTTKKARFVVVTIRCQVKPKLNEAGQAILDKLGRLGLIPSMATLWSITRLSFIVDWFYNIGGAIENLQGSLTHDVSNVSVCISDTRTREITRITWGTTGLQARWVGYQRYYSRIPTTVPLLPPLLYPRRYMQYVLLGFIALASTSGGRKLTKQADRVLGDYYRFINDGKFLPKRFRGSYELWPR